MGFELYDHPSKDLKKDAVGPAFALLEHEPADSTHFMDDVMPEMTPPEETQVQPHPRFTRACTVCTLENEAGTDKCTLYRTAPQRVNSRQTTTTAPIYKYVMGDAVTVYFNQKKHSGVITSRIAHSTTHNIQFDWGTAPVEQNKIRKFPPAVEQPSALTPMNNHYSTTTTTTTTITKLIRSRNMTFSSKFLIRKNSFKDTLIHKNREKKIMLVDHPG